MIEFPFVFVLSFLIVFLAIGTVFIGGLVIFLMWGLYRAGKVE